MARHEVLGEVKGEVKVENASAAMPSAQHFSQTRDWPGYFRAVIGKPPRDTLLGALQRFDAERLVDAEVAERPGVTSGKFAVDFGCGEGRDTLELLARGWRVHAFDGHQIGLDLLRERVPDELKERVKIELAGFAGARWEKCQLLNASFALPFCLPGEFAGVWARVVDSIEVGGRFAGQLFGDRDSWATIPDRTHHQRSELDGLFRGFVLEELREEEKDSADAVGTPKHWHVYHVIARKA